MIVSTVRVQLQWAELGQMLRIPPDVLTKFEKKYPSSISRCHYEVMRYWIVKTNAHWVDLVTALGSSQIAKDIEEKHINSKEFVHRWCVVYLVSFALCSTKG